MGVGGLYNGSEFVLQTVGEIHREEAAKAKCSKNEYKLQFLPATSE